MNSVIEELQDKQAHMKSPGKGTAILASSHSPEPADTVPEDGDTTASGSDAEYVLLMHSSCLFNTRQLHICATCVCSLSYSTKSHQMHLLIYCCLPLTVLAILNVSPASQRSCTLALHLSSHNGLRPDVQQCCAFLPFVT